ncbi:MAG TPA: methyltransferase domain-containing protein [Vicinamibacterales bacterium]|jgi:2-polyprenyl-3-methyl-5-hydroxy-6-metoxy-1,4-benzoquinol methylase|nr:methyltransferase domain-containing protein [Vicinamibacterales bacterium]
MAVRIDPEHNERAALMLIGTHFDAARVLEVGCGDGRLTRTFAAQARSVVAIDPDPQAVGDFRAAAWPSHVEALPVGFEAFDPARRRFDVILFSWSL